MKGKNQQDKLANFKRRNLTNFTFLTKKESPLYLEMDVSQNFIMSLDELVRFNFENILTLNLSINLIVSLQPLTQCYMPKLKIIFLQGNQIESTEPLKRCKFPLLQNLILGFSNRGNNIKSQSDLAKCSFPELKQLAVDCNEIKCLKSLQSYPFKQITLLYFAKNKIESIPEEALSGFTNLKMVSFSKNQIKKESNFIRSLRFLARPKFQQLTYLNLEENQIMELGEIHRYSMKSLGKIVYALNNIYCQQDIMKCDWQNAAGFNNLVQKEGFNYMKSFLEQIYNKFLAKSVKS